MPRGDRTAGELGLPAAVSLIEDQLDGTVAHPPGMAPLGLDGKVPAVNLPEPPTAKSNGFAIYRYTGDGITHTYALDIGQQDGADIPQFWIGGPAGAPETMAAFDPARARVHIEGA